MLELKSNLERMLELVEFNGARYIVRNHEKTPFQMELGSSSLRHFFHPIYSTTLGYFEQNEILRQWKMLEKLNNLLGGMKAVNGSDLAGFVGKKCQVLGI